MTKVRPTVLFDSMFLRVECAVIMQGSHLAGGGEGSVGVGVEGAPLTLLEGVTDFLIHQRAALRKEANASEHFRFAAADANPGVCKCKCIARACARCAKPVICVSMLVEGAGMSPWPTQSSPVLHESQQ